MVYFTRHIFIISIFLYCFSAVYASSAGHQEQVQLRWSPVAEINPDESTFLPSLHFSNALYPDSLPTIPVYIHRQKNTIPHFSFDFALADKETRALNEGELAIAEASGYAASDFKVVRDTETTRGQTYSRFHIIPIRKKDGVYEKLTSFSIKASPVYDFELEQGNIHTYPDSSVLANGQWYKVCVKDEGIYRLGHQDLSDLGMNPSQISKSTLQIFGNGGGMLPESNALFRYTDPQENAIYVSGNNSGTFGANDYILFYGQSPNRWSYDPETSRYNYTRHHYSEETCYFITHGQNEGKRISSRQSLTESPTHTATDFMDYAHHQRDLTNIIGSGKLWFGELFDVTLTRDFAFSLSNVVQQKPVHIEVYAAARSSAPSSFTIQALNQSQNLPIAGVNVANATGFYARHAIQTLSAMPQGNNLTVSLTYNRTASGSRGWLNYISVNYHRELRLNGNQMFFRNHTNVGSNNRVRFQLTDVSSGSRIWDVTDPLNIQQQQFDQNGSSATFTVAMDSGREFVVFRNTEYLKPALRGQVPNQNLHASQVTDLIIVVPGQFRQQAERLAEFRRDFDGLTVKLVSPQEIYNEFSSGATDISAIRNYMKMYYDRARENNGNYPRYLLLFGNGTYDNKNILGFGGNIIPTFQTQQSLTYAQSYITDDFFGLLDDNEGLDAFGTIDIGIGRLPVRTVDEARFVVDKLLRYNQRIEGLEPGTEDPRFAGVIPNYADWRNVITIIADDEDNNIHFQQAELLANYLQNNHRVYNVEKIYLDAYEQVTLAGGSRYPEVNRAINNRINQGTLLWNYVGHGGPLGLAHERILTFDDILQWKNFYNMPVLMTATCEFSSFDQPDANELSAGVRIFLKPDGGAAALFTTTRLAYSHSNFSLNNAFMRNAFIPMENGEMPRLGDLIRLAKVESSSTSTLKNFVLLGDPSMQMAYPRYKAITTEVSDTMRALDRITVRGEIQTPEGIKASYYNGVIYPTLYDKKATYSTLGNDPGSQAAPFTMQNRILYRGKASVINGEFEFTFIVPLDISYNNGFGKISYYFDDGISTDGKGYYDNFIISGTSDNFTPDDQGPEISLYLNNLNFRSGDSTGPDPVLLAYLEDESGINTTGQIGHDIVAFLNNDTSNPFILNDFYQADLDSYQSGRVVFPFFNLEKGNYTLSLRAWDVHNNVSTTTIDFVVTSAPGIKITELINYPNPFSERTRFSIEHNKPATELNILIEIFSLNGQLIRSIEENVYASGFNIPPIEWDGRDDGGTLLQNGIYVFRALVSTNGGDQTQRTEKLILLR